MFKMLHETNPAGADELVRAAGAAWAGRARHVRSTKATCR
jgi:hypothetical protein